MPTLLPHSPDRATSACMCRSLVFPHLSTATSLLRTPSALCVLAEYASGGSLFGMVRRGSAAGLPTPAAAFLFQQLTVTAHFGRGVGLWLHRVRPAKLLVAWNDKAMPIVKVNVVGYDWPDAPEVSGGVRNVQEAEMEDDAEATAEAEVLSGHCVCSRACMHAKPTQASSSRRNALLNQQS